MISTARSNQQQLVRISSQTLPHSAQTDRQTLRPARRAGFKSSAIRKRYLVWYTRSYRVTKTVFTSNLLSCAAEWTVTSYIDVYRQVLNAVRIPRPFPSMTYIALQHLLLSHAGRQKLSSGFACRMTKSGWREKGVPAFMRRLLLRMFANAVKTSVCVVGASLGEYLHRQLLCYHWQTIMLCIYYA